MPDNPVLRIGPFSRASSLSIKALRAYHEAGLLVPAEIDPRTGYRSYSVAQLTDAAIVRRLRQLDLPLDAISEVLAARDPAVTSKVLTEHGAVLEARLGATQQAIDELYVALEAPMLHTPVHHRREPARTVLTFTATVSEAEWSFPRPVDPPASVSESFRRPRSRFSLTGASYDDLEDTYRTLGAWVATNAM